MSTKFNIPRWAYNPLNPSQDVVEPNNAKKQQGFQKQEPILRQWLNWLLNGAGEGLLNLSTSATAYDDLADFIANAEPGDTGLVRAPASTVAPLDEVYAADPLTASLTSIDTDGQYIVCAWATATPSVDVRERDGATLVQTLSLTNVPTSIQQVRTNGDAILVAYDTYVECFNTSDFASRWVYDHAAAVASCALDDDQAYLAGATSGGVEVRALNLTTGALVASYAHGALVNSVITDGARVYIGGNAGTGGNHIRAIPRNMGAAVWSLIDNAVAAPDAMACDGEDLWVGTSSTLLRIMPKFGVVVDQDTGAGVNDLTLTTRYLIMARSSAVVYLDRKSSYPLLANGTSTSQDYPGVLLHGGAVTVVGCDGDRIYAGGALALGATLRIHEMPRLADRMYKRRDPNADRVIPMRALAHPLE